MTKSISTLSLFLCCLTGFLLPNPALAQQKPKALRPNITIEKYMTVGPGCVRLLQDPVSKDFFYTTFPGEVYRVSTRTGKPVATRILSDKDHGITRLQGAAFNGNALFLVGNISVNQGKGTKGRMVRYQFQPSGKGTMSVVFMTDDVGSTKTLYDHGFNGIAISPDGKYAYVSSGARTDHGEVQDNDGHYPNSRDEPLTACILRIPTDATNLLLPNDDAKLKAAGYLFAKGIRNAYDLAFAPNGHLFAVSNSSDYDHPEDMFWLREGHHYGFPWVMGGVDNPQQFPNWDADPKKDPFINTTSHAHTAKYFHNDPKFPKRPAKITPSVQNLGPDANQYRDRSTGQIKDADKEGITLGTFTAHRSPLGLVFDTDSVLSGNMKGDGFVLSWSNGRKSPLMRPIALDGEDMLHLKLTYRRDTDNYVVQTTKIAQGFNSPTDALMIGNVIYVLEYGNPSGSIWKITLPGSKAAVRR
ncbi:hypothetical protein GCM10023189_48170 [Nibrella saemangeumensis]|uniref:Glucose/arabinose dehydrogenase, beta-propeller fold n=1 Tax=Nibrella saemangeumensis TaxID=1084526 RepID=A0ABP8NJB7_9BACT